MNDEFGKLENLGF